MTATATRQTPDQQRSKLLRLLHVEAAKRGVTHETLSQGAREHWGVESMSHLTLAQLRDYVERVCNRPEKRTDSPARPVGPSRPRGRTRPDGVIWTATPRQRRFIESLLERSSHGLPDPVGAAFRFAKRVLGSDLVLEDAPAGTDGLAAIAAAVGTGKAAGQLINALIGSLKKRGLWE
jgi:hypothetical protein